MGLTYGSKEAVDFCHTLGFTMADTAIASSALLAKERGSYEQFCAEEVMETPYFKANTTEETVQLVKSYGLRNSQLLTIAPTGTLSTMLVFPAALSRFMQTIMSVKQNPFMRPMSITRSIRPLWNAI